MTKVLRVESGTYAIALSSKQALALQVCIFLHRDKHGKILNLGFGAAAKAKGKAEPKAQALAGAKGQAKPKAKRKAKARAKASTCIAQGQALAGPSDPGSQLEQ